MIIDGKATATQIQEELKAVIEEIPGRKPCLAVVIVGEDPASHVYVRNKKKACERVGIESRAFELPDATPENELMALIQKLNDDDTVDGILVQLPLPKGMDPQKVIAAIDPDKDVDGFHPVNQGKLLTGDESGFAPCTPLGIKVLLQRQDIPTEGRHVVILGRSNIVGKPLAALLVQKGEGANATVTIAHSASKNLAEICQTADILIAAVGRPGMVKPAMVKPGAAIVDVGINRVEDPTKEKGYRIVGDVDFEGVKEKVSKITPVPGGVGPMTIAMLLSNTLLSYRRKEKHHHSAVSDTA